MLLKIKWKNAIFGIIKKINNIIIANKKKKTFFLFKVGFKNFQQCC